MTLEYLLLVSSFCSLSMSYDNGLQLWKDCPSMQSVRGSKGSLFEITIQTFENECKTLLSKSDIEEATKIRKQRNSLDMQLTINNERANITWNVQFKNRCYRRIYMLDVEYLIRNVEGNGAIASHWCFQYNVSNVENKQQKERVDFFFDCIHTVPDKEAYLVNIKLWSLQQNWSLSSRSRRSVKSDCGRIQCITSMKKFLSIGPIKPIDDKERIKRCQCWSNSTISLNQTTNTKDKHFSIAVENPNPYATVIIAKVYKERNDTIPVFTVSSVEKVNTFLTDISCEKEEGTYTPVLGYNCGGQKYSTNSLCQLQDIEGSSITCPGPVKKYVPPPVDIPHITIVVSVLAGVFVTVAVTVIIFVCKRKGFWKSFMREAGLNWNNRFNPDFTSVESRIENPGEDSKDVQMQLLRLPDLSSRRRSMQIMFLDHTDSYITPLRKDCVNLISELLQTVGMELLGLDRTQLFKNWIEVAERASKDDITEILIIMSRELVSCQNSFMKSQRNSEAISMESENITDYFPGAVLKILRDRSILQQREPFRIHILCLEYSDSQLCEKYIDTYSTFMIVKGDRKNTFLYYFAKCVQHTNSFSFDENVMPCLLKRLNRTTTLPENAKIYASKLKDKFLELFENSAPAPLEERTDTYINCATEDPEQILYSSDTKVRSGPLSNKRKHKDRSECFPFLRSVYSKAITKCSQSREKVSLSGDEIELEKI